MAVEKLGAVFAERELDLLSEGGEKVHKVLVQLGKPRPLPGYEAYRCHFKIIGMGTEKVRYGEGADAMQALILALTKIGSLLYTSDESQSKRLSWMDMWNLGFPAYAGEDSDDLVPGPADRLLL